MTDIMINGFFDELVKRFSSDASRQLLLAGLNFPHNSIPNATSSPREFWFDVCTMIDYGILSSGGLEVLIERAALVYPGNRLFAPYSQVSSKGSELRRFAEAERTGAPDEVVIQRAITQPQSDGNHLSLKPDLTLPEQDIRDNDSLNIATAARAGGSTDDLLLTISQQISELTSRLSNIETILNASHAAPFTANSISGMSDYSALKKSMISPRAADRVLRMPTQEPPVNRQYLYLIVSDWEDIDDLLPTVLRTAGDAGLTAEGIRLEFSNEDSVWMSLSGWSREDSEKLVATLNQNAGERGGKATVTLHTSPFPDYLLRRFIIEGPDQSKFEIREVPASTYLRDLIRELINSEYQNSTGDRNAGREVSVDRHREDGSTERLNVDSTLHESDIRENDTLSVSPAARAGSDVLTVSSCPDATITIAVTILPMMEQIP